MTERRESDGRPEIDHWETFEILHSDTASVGRELLGIEIEAQRPVYQGGGTGRLNMGVVIRRGDRTLRLFCPRGSTKEISALRAMLLRLEDGYLQNLEERFRELVVSLPPQRPPDRGGRGTEGRSPRPGEASGGPGRSSVKESKRENRRRRQRPTGGG